MSLKKLKYIFLFAVIFSLHSKTIVLDSEAVKNIASRDAYDLLSKICTVHGFSYGIIGQPVMFKRIGKESADISLYIDGIYYGRSLEDLSFLSVDQIDSLILDDRSVENSGMTVSIFTKSFNTPIPVSEVKYRDAFFNYRNLEADIFQHVSKDFSFLLSGEIFDWKDGRDSYDNFRFPYQKQNYRLKITLPQMTLTKPVLDISYRKQEKFRLDADSSLIKPETIRSVLYLDNKISGTNSNRFSAVHIHEINDNTYNYFSFYDTFTFADSLSRLESSMGLNAEFDESHLMFFKTDFQKKSFIDYGLNGYFAMNDESDPVMSSHLNLSKDFNPIISLETTHGYFSDGTKSRDTVLIENFFTLKKVVRVGKSALEFSAGYDMFNYADDPADVPDSINGSSVRNFYRFQFAADYKNRLKFKNEYLRSASGKIYDTVLMNNISEISLSDKYFNDKLTVNLALNHIYSEYFIGSRIQYINNLSFNFRARIVNFELFYGSDNFLKDKYEFNNRSYEANKHYNYQTIDDFNMRTKDEIWGIRWVFYQ